MNFARSETQIMVADMLGRLLRDRNDFAARRARLAEVPPRRLALWPDLAEAGIIGALFPESAGGFGGSGRDVAVVAYEAGQSLVVEPLAGVLMSGRLLLAAGTEGASMQVGRMIAGEQIVILAHDEGFDPFAAPRMQAHADGSGYRLTGTKPVVPHADDADLFIVTATLPDGTTGCFLLPPDREGVGVEPFRLIDASGGASLILSDAPADLLLQGAPAVTAVKDAVEWGLLSLCAEAIGIIDALNAQTRDYLRTRVQFGVPIGSFQALQHRSADMFIAGEEAGVAVDAVANGFDESPGDHLRSARISAAKIVVGEAGRKVGFDAIQLHGGVGVSDELPISHYMRRLAAIRTQLGGSEVHRSRFSALAA